MIQGAHAACGVSMLYQAQEALEILPAIAAIPELMSQSRRHNDQEYDIIYYLQGGDMWHIGKYSETTHLSDYFGYFWRYSALKSLGVAPLAMPAFFALPIAKINSN